MRFWEEKKRKTFEANKQLWAELQTAQNQCLSIAVWHPLIIFHEYKV